MATADQYATWIVNNKDKKGSKDFEIVAKAYKEARAEESAGQVSQPEPQPQEKGFIDNVSDKLTARGEKFGKDMYQAGDDFLSLNPATSLSGGMRGLRRLGGAVAGAGADIIGEGVSSLADTLIPDSIQNTAKDAMNYLGDTSVGQGAGSAVRSIAEIYKGFKEGSPVLAQDLEDVTNMATMAIPAKLKLSLPKGNLSSIVTKSPKSVLQEVAPDISTLKEKAGEIYAILDNSGGRVGGSKLNNLGTKTKEVLDKAGYDRDLYPSLSVIIKRLDEAAGKKLTITEIQNLRKLTDAPLNSANRAEVRLGGIARDSIDDFIGSLNTKDFGGTLTGNVGAKLKDARQMWRRSRALETIETAVSKADLQASGLENGIRTQFRSILNNPNKSKGFTTAELAELKTVVKGGRLENLTKALGKFGFTEGQASSMLLSSMGVAAGATAGGAAGAVAIPMIGQVSKSLAQYLTRRNAAGVKQIIAAGAEGEDIVKAYMSIVPKAERRAEDLTQLLLRPDVSLAKLKELTPKAKKSQSTLVANALYLTALSQREGAE